MQAIASIVIPTFNRRDFLELAILSALAQTVPVEVIVVDHGSSDGTREFMESFGRGVTYIRRELDSGPHFAWLDGVLATSSEFVKLLYDDDLLEPTFVEKTTHLFTPSVGFVFTRAIIQNEEGEKVFELFSNMFGSGGVYSDSKSRKKARRPIISPTAVMFRRQELIDGIFVDSLPLQNHSFRGVGADHYIKLLALSRYPGFGYVDEALAIFRNHPGSITVSTGEDDATKREMMRAYADVAAVARVNDLVAGLGLTDLLRALGQARRQIKKILKYLGRYMNQIRRFGILPIRFRRGARSNL